ncbi:substrate carrier protein [Artemisia annua]|uniref:Substrate carrier protein n=1 Tax=Artemisia annua TaxID=35608 RepID=A0A2U1QM67_ARTAN|nr:substrate carrier protein [Artemisia annua]
MSQKLNNHFTTTIESPTSSSGLFLDNNNTLPHYILKNSTHFSSGRRSSVFRQKDWILRNGFCSVSLSGKGSESLNEKCAAAGDGGGGRSCSGEGFRRKEWVLGNGFCSVSFSVNGSENLSKKFKKVGLRLRGKPAAVNTTKHLWAGAVAAMVSRFLKKRISKTHNTTSKDDTGIVGEISNREISSLVNLSKIYGRDEAKIMLIHKICNQDTGIRHDDDDVRILDKFTSELVSLFEISPPIPASSLLVKNLFELIKFIASSQGLRGFWKGNFVNILRTAPFKALNFCAYDSYRKQLLRLTGNEETSNFERLFAGAGAGMTASILCLPLDTISNREISSLVNLSKIYGGDEKKIMLIHKICNQDTGIRHDDDDVRVYAIWGMGSIRKTTLAQYVYHLETVRTNFDLKSWCIMYVYNEFDDRRIIKSICASEDPQLDAMQVCLQNKLRVRNFFIVMDDVWIENKYMEKWDELCKTSSSGAKGSTVMILDKFTSELVSLFEISPPIPASSLRVVLGLYPLGQKFVCGIEFRADGVNLSNANNFMFMTYESLNTMVTKGKAAKATDSTSPYILSYVRSAKRRGCLAKQISFNRTTVAPLERLKLEYMVRGEQKNLFELIKFIASSQGLRGFWKGNFVNILRTAPFKALNFCAYDSYRKQLLRLTGNEETSNFERLFAGAGAGMTASILCLPLDTIRTKLVAPGGESLGGVIGAFRHIIQTEGFFSLYKGLVPSILSMAPASAVFYGVYDILKSAYLNSPEGKQRIKYMNKQGGDLNILEQLELGPVRTLLHGAIAGACAEDLSLVYCRYNKGAFWVFSNFKTFLLTYVPSQPLYFYGDEEDAYDTCFLRASLNETAVCVDLYLRLFSCPSQQVDFHDYSHLPTFQVMHDMVVLDFALGASSFNDHI